MIHVVRLSMVHSTLPRAEVLAVLEAAGESFKELNYDGRYLRVDCSLEALENVLKRCAYVKEVFTEVKSSTTVEDLYRGLDLSMLPKRSKNGLSFAVEADKPMRHSLEPSTGDLIKKLTGWKVNLRNPDVVFKLAKVDGINVLGVSMGKVSLRGFHSREPKFRPVSHPSTMKPMLARCMVNLARVKPGDVVLDPFCGVGGILIEAGLVGCRVLGLDVDPKLVRGCLINLRWSGVKHLGLAAGDSRRIPFKEFKTFVSDLPYGRASKTLGYSPMSILRDFLECVSHLVSKGVYACIGVARLKYDERFFMERGFRIVEKHTVKEHKSLTREILVLKRV